MARPPLPVGTAGVIKATELAKGKWKARCRVRDADGVTREMVRYGKTKPESIANLKVAVKERPSVVSRSGEMSPTSSVHALWERFRQSVADDGRSSATLDSYDLSGRWITAGMGGLQLREVRTQRLDDFLREIAGRHGAPSAKRTKTVLTGMFRLAVRLGALEVNPARETAGVTQPRRRAKSLDAAALAALLSDVRTSKLPCPVVLVASQVKRGMKPTTKPGQIPTVAAFCAASDLADVITLFAATGCRIGELMGVRWEDVNLEAKTLSVTGQVVREKGVGLLRQDWAKTPTSIRTVALPGFAVDMLRAREQSGEMVFTSKAGTLRDPDTVARQWRQVRAALDLEWVTSHTFRKTVATILDEEGLSARQAADQLGHAQVSMTQDVYFGRGRTHQVAADALGRVLQLGE